MRRVFSIALPLLFAATVYLKITPGMAPDGPYDLVSYGCDSCNRRVVTRTVDLAECQRAAYGMNDGGDAFMQVTFRANQKFECRPAAN